MEALEQFYYSLRENSPGGGGRQAINPSSGSEEVNGGGGGMPFKPEWRSDPGGQVGTWEGRRL